jgi:predicted DsbA family dithiol-disulfide isomerase
VGKRRLEKAMTTIAARRNKPATALFDVRWRPFQLNAGSSLEGVDKMKMYAQKFGADRVRAMIPRMVETGQGCEPPIQFSYGGKSGNTLRSHRVVEFARLQGGAAGQDRAIEALFKRYFEQEKNICDVDVLVEAAAEAGLDGAAVRALLADPAAAPAAPAVEREEEECRRRYGVSGVPHFVIGTKYSFSGAQDSATLANVLDECLQEP